MDELDAETQELSSLGLPQNSLPFVEFKSSLKQARLGPQHPTRVMESSSLSAIKLPNVKYRLSDELLSGCLSDTQLEAIILACHSHTQMLNERRLGMLIGDGAGVGKGRTIAGIILENICRGRKKSIWLSTNFDLFQDAMRDFKSLGMPDVEALRSFRNVYDKNSNSLPAGNYCLFATYRSLSGIGRGKPLLALRKWLGGTFSGVIALDECHALKTEGTNNHKCLFKLDKMFPNSRFVYCSATIAESAKDLEYMSRLGLWGPGTAFPLGFTQLQCVLDKTGFIGMEALALELKHCGRYIARRLDQSGAEFGVEEVVLSEDDVKLYNGCTRLWFRILRGVKSSSERRLFKFRYFWATHQRFFRLLNLSFKLEWTLSYVREQLAIGNAVVLGLQSTGYSKLCLKKRKWYARIPSTLLLTIKDVAKHVLDEDPELAEEVIYNARRLNLPPNFLDVLINKLGTRNVSELSGRTERLVEVGSKFQWEKIKDSRVKAQSKFMSGKTCVAVISDACSCGISLHASTECANQKRRVHITLELPWSAEKIVQQCGRTLRSNQLSAPKYILVVTDAAGEKRFGYGISAKLQTLGAITQADRTLSVNSLETFSMSTKEAETAILYTLQSIGLVIPPVLTYPGKDIYDFFRNASKPLLALDLLDEGEEEMKPRRPIRTMRFLNRLLGVKLPVQNEIYNYMLDIYNEVLQQSKQLGTFVQGVIDIGKRTSRLISSQKFKLQGTRVNLIKVKADQGVSFAEVNEMKKKANYSRFYAVEVVGFRYVYALIRFFSTGKYFRVYPCRVSNEEASPYQRGEGYAQVSTNQAKEIWNKVFRAGDTCFHRQQRCEDQNYKDCCGAFNRFQVRTMILGMRWSNLEKVSELMDSADVKPLQLVRCQLEDRIVLGLYVPEEKYSTVEELLQHGI